MAKFDVFDESNFRFLRDYVKNASPSGFEAPGQKIWLNYIKPYVDDYMVGNYGSAAGIINPGPEYKVVIEARSDEISWFVNFISEDGFIYVKKLGGADHQIPPSKRAYVLHLSESQTGRNQ